MWLYATPSFRVAVACFLLSPLPCNGPQGPQEHAFSTTLKREPRHSKKLDSRHVSQTHISTSIIIAYSINTASELNLTHHAPGTTITTVFGYTAVGIAFGTRAECVILDWILVNSHLCGVRMYACMRVLVSAYWLNRSCAFRMLRQASVDCTLAGSNRGLY